MLLFWGNTLSVSGSEVPKHEITRSVWTGRRRKFRPANSDVFSMSPMMIGEKIRRGIGNKTLVSAVSVTAKQGGRGGERTKGHGWGRLVKE